MPPTNEFPFRHVSFSPGALTTLPAHVKRAALSASGSPRPESDSLRSLLVGLASELMQEPGDVLPDWVDAETRYLVVADVPEPALLRLPTVLRVHKPDQRIHVTRDRDAMKRQAIAIARDHPFEGVVDAYVLWRELWVVLGDMSIRCFPARQIPGVADLPDEELGRFEIHPSGSYLAWNEGAIRIGPSQLLQAADPMHLADVLIDRYATERVSLALRLLRESRGLYQSDISGVSERHVRRLEKEEVRLTSDAASRYAEAFGYPLDEFLSELSRTVSRLQSSEPSPPSPVLRA